MRSTALLTPVLLALTFAFITFWIVLIGAAIGVFTINFYSSRREGDPEAFAYAGRRAFLLFSGGLHSYFIASPDWAARRRIREIEKTVDLLNLLLKVLVKEIGQQTHSRQHFSDVMEATGRLILLTVFEDGPDLQHFRLAFFGLEGDRLEYRVAVHNGDWTSHSGEGFVVSKSFMGEALAKDKPLIFPRDRGRKTLFKKRKQCRYNSFIVIPVPCGQGRDRQIGALSVDYTGTHEVFTEDRVEMLCAFSQLLYAFHTLNINGVTDELTENIGNRPGG